MRQIIFLLSFLATTSVVAQVTYGTPEDGDIPEKLKNIPIGIEVMHFPKVNDPIKIKDSYYWKHSTGILSKNDKITITEFGAYLFYNDQWNLRKTYKLKELDKFFGTKKQVLPQAQPQIWTKNWRVGEQLFGGWALWYFIGTDSSGQTICGYASIHTTDNLLNK